MTRVARFQRVRPLRWRSSWALRAVMLPVALACDIACGAVFEVGDGRPYPAVANVPWESLSPGDTVLIYWRSTPYREKWVIGRQGTAAAPITVCGVPGPAGQLPIIDGAGATTRLQLDYWSESRGIIKIGGSSIPPDTMPAYIVIENLDIRGARLSNAFTDDSGSAQSYSINASSIYVEKGENIVVRNCIIHDSGNGLFVASSDDEPSRNVLFEGNYIYGNGNAGSLFEHNTYTAAIGMTYQFNRFGPLLAGAGGNNLKDRSAGLVVRYNWIESGNRQLDLVDAEDSIQIRNDPAYRQTFVYGNILIEPDGAGNSQIVHYGGDSGAAADYRMGTLYFYNNTVVSTRSGNTTLFRLSTNQEHCDARNNIAYVTATGDRLYMLDSTGVLDMTHNWFKPGWGQASSGLAGMIHDDGTSVVGPSPGFVDFSVQDYHLAAGSPCVNTGTFVHPAALPQYDIVREYIKHLSSRPRQVHGAAMDIGAFERPLLGDYDANGAWDLLDWRYAFACFTGPQLGPYAAGCAAFDFDEDGDVDLVDIATFQTFAGP